MNILTVEWNEEGGTYKVTYANGNVWFVPKCEENTDYQEIKKFLEEKK